ncbi:hypothetical protein [Ensifer sp. LCM 4579]|uniref:hypothetical protein n=1 Tax=Ensifer sp. LCM 4579 TaxID=1848292 RepID=UPI0008DA95FF|nr:hypothetical protein [Ensifer sp. LCM 4579]OHV71818.1 hypothetical protein LCM4579_13630 [Ensifer sp. LCM 4579]
MDSFRAAAFVAASVFLMLTATKASACSCGESDAKEKFAQADLVIKGRMKTVTYGIEMPDSESTGEIPRLTRGEVEIEKVLKGTFKEKTVSVYTGSGLGDCGRLGEFINAAVYYEHKEFGVFELGLVKTEFAGQTFYMSSICDYAKGPKVDEQKTP